MRCVPARPLEGKLFPPVTSGRASCASSRHMSSSNRPYGNTSNLWLGWAVCSSSHSPLSHCKHFKALIVDIILSGIDTLEHYCFNFTEFWLYDLSDKKMLLILITPSGSFFKSYFYITELQSRAFFTSRAQGRWKCITPRTTVKVVYSCYIIYQLNLWAKTAVWQHQ